MKTLLYIDRRAHVIDSLVNERNGFVQVNVHKQGDNVPNAVAHSLPIWWVETKPAMSLTTNGHFYSWTPPEGK